jgi:Protein of unknown function (DUF422).
MFKSNNLSTYSSLIIWTFQVFGAVGILFWNREWFIQFIPICLILYFLILLKNNKNNNIFFLFIVFCWGMLSEIIGVNTGLIFGSYTYGNSLGIKLMNVPIVNWS